MEKPCTKKDYMGKLTLKLLKKLLIPTDSKKISARKLRRLEIILANKLQKNPPRHSTIPKDWDIYNKSKVQKKFMKEREIEQNKKLNKALHNYITKKGPVEN